MSTPTDIELPKYPAASRAELHRAGGGWSITFSGRELFAEDDVTITVDTLVEAGGDPSRERLVTGYMETRLLAAGYGIAPSDDKPADAVEGWTLRG